MTNKEVKEKLVYGSLKALASLPLPLLYLLSDFAYLIIYGIVGYRKKVVRKNLTESFPEKSLREIKKIERGFYRFLGDQIVETVKLLNISPKEMAKRVNVTHYDIVNETLSQGKNAVLLLGHYGNWEWVQEITRYFIPDSHMISIYHPLSNKTWDDLFINIRSRWGANIVEMVKAPRVLLSRKNQPWVCGFIADAWTWHKNEDNWVDFLNHKTWFIYGPEDIGRKTGADFFYLEMNRKKRGYYDIIFHRLEPKDLSQPYPYTREFWKEFEKTIEKNPALWLWSHKRWK